MDGIPGIGSQTGGMINGVPADYRKISSNGRNFFINKGSLNKFKLRSAVLNEHVESSNQIQETVQSDQIVGQIFKASQDNINTIAFTARSNEASVFDNFNSSTYADNAALQAAWVLTGINLAVLETSIVYEGDQSMELNLNTLADEWARSFTTKDYTGYTVSLYYRQNEEFDFAKLSFFVEDTSGNSRSQLLAINSINVWEFFEINIDTMSDDQAPATDLTQINKFGFRVDDKQNFAVGYVDYMTETPPPGKIKIKLFDFGTSLPESVAINTATQYITIGDLGLDIPYVSSIDVSLIGGKRLYLVENFICGTALEYGSQNYLLNKDNYYALTFNYINTELDLFGPDISLGNNYYVNGYAFTAPDESTPISQIDPLSNLMFWIFSNQDVYLTRYFQSLDGAPGALAKTNLYIEDMNMQIIEKLAINAVPVQVINADLNAKPIFMPKGSKFEQYYNDDFSDSVNRANIQIGGKYKELPNNIEQTFA